MMKIHEEKVKISVNLSKLAAMIRVCVAFRLPKIFFVLLERVASVDFLEAIFTANLMHITEF